MMIATREAPGALRASRRIAWRASQLSIAVMTLCWAPTRAIASSAGQADASAGGRFCSQTAKALFTACGKEVDADYWTAQGICINVSDETERTQCFAEAEAARSEGNELCGQQWASRRAACKLLGEERYDPDFDPALFDPDFQNPTNPNPYFPVKIGDQWDYRGGTESNTIVVLDRTKLIDGVTCVVVRDTVFDQGKLKEDTDDWYAQAKDANIWYCGEEVKDYQTFDGDKPPLPELVSIGGSFKAGRDGDKPGIIFLASPEKGDAYLEEFSLGNAEDVTEILSVDYAYGSDPELDRLVPPALAKLLCAGDCIVTKNYSLLEPGIFARKYFARGVGFFLEVSPDTASVTQLVGCNFDPRCAALPQP